MVVKKMTPVLWVMTVVFLAWACALTYKYINLGFDNWDFAFFNQSFWNLTQGHQYSSIFGYNFLGDHASYGAFLILPFYAVFPSPLTLLYVKAAAFALSLYFLYLIAREKLGDKGALLMTILFSFFVPNSFAMLYEFSFECFAPLFIFMMFYAHRKDDLRLFWIAALCLCLTKENLILVVMAFGVYGLFQRRSFAWTWGTLIFALLTLALAMISVKYFRGGEGVSAWLRYKHLFVSPQALQQYFFSAENGHFWQELSGPFFGLAFLPSVPLWLGIPVFLQHALSIHVTEHRIFYFYAFALTPFIFIAGIDALARVRARLGRLIYVSLLAVVTTGCLLGIVCYEKMLMGRIGYLNAKEVHDRWALIQNIPPSASVVASFDVLVPLSSRASIYPFYKVFNEKFQDLAIARNTEFAMGRLFEIPRDVAYALIDLDDPWMDHSVDEQRRVDAFLSQGWCVLDQRGTLRLLYRQVEK